MTIIQAMTLGIHPGAVTRLLNGQRPVFTYETYCSILVYLAWHYNSAIKIGY